VLGAYGAGAVVLLRRQAIRRSHARAARIAADAVAALAADLTAGVAEDRALLEAARALRSAVDTYVPARPPVHARRVASAVSVSKASGAPLAEVLHRLEKHLRSLDRARASAETQAAGARASAALLAVMPIAGIGLGVAIGIDPLHVLLHTTIGGAVLCLSVALQIGGLAWTARLATVEITP
jgi:tight adherence protein B